MEASPRCRAESVLLALAESRLFMASESRRLSILTAQEIRDLYDPPRFTEEDRSLYFDLSPAERKLVDGVFTISVAVHLVLQLGYFKAKRQFFVYGLNSVMEDVDHILQRYFLARAMAEIKRPSRSNRLEQQRVVLKLFDYRSCGPGAKKELEEKARRVAMLSAQPVFILQEALHLPAGHGRADRLGGTAAPDPAARSGADAGVGASAAGPSQGRRGDVQDQPAQA
jgi:hypothetical protein